MVPIVAEQSLNMKNLKVRKAVDIYLKEHMMKSDKS